MSFLQIVFAVLGGWGMGIYTAMKVCHLIIAGVIELRTDAGMCVDLLRQHVQSNVYRRPAQVFGGKEKEAQKDALVEAKA